VLPPQLEEQEQEQSRALSNPEDLIPSFDDAPEDGDDDEPDLRISAATLFRRASPPAVLTRPVGSKESKVMLVERVEAEEQLKDPYYAEEQFNAPYYADAATIVVMKASYEMDGETRIAGVEKLILPHYVKFDPCKALMSAYWRRVLVALQDNDPNIEQIRCTAPNPVRTREFKGDGDVIIVKMRDHAAALAAFEAIQPVGHPSFKRVRWQWAPPAKRLLRLKGTRQ